MIRPDLLSLSEQDLIRATSVGIVKRAKREFDSASASAFMEGDDIVVRWTDGITCRFPPASSVRGTCTCPADDVCRHLARSVLYLIEHKDSIVRTFKSPTTPTISQSLTIERLLALPREDFQKQLGKQKLSRARRAIKGNIETKVINATEHVVTFPRVGIEVRFPPGASLDSAICDCKEHAPCSHILPALLILRGENSASPSADHSIDDHVVRHSLRRVKDLAHELIRVGIDGLSLAWCDAVRTTALEIEKLGLAIPSELLNTLAREVEAELTGESPFHPHTLRVTLAKLWIRIALADRETALPISGGDLIDRPPPHYWSTSSARLTGVGLRAWQTEKIKGITLYLREERSGEIVSTGTGRPLERRYSALSLASHASIFGEAPALELLGHAADCSGIKLAENGKVLLGEGATCEISRNAVSWNDIIERDGITRWSSLAERLQRDYPSLLSHRRERHYWFKPRAWGEAVLTINHQSLEWPMIDADGKTLHVSYSYNSERSHAFKSLKHFAATASPTALFGILRFHAGRPHVEPITIFHSANSRTEAYCIDLERDVGR